VGTKEQTVSSRAPERRSLAHVRRNDGEWCEIHDLEEHLRAVDVMAQCVIARHDPKTAN